MTLPDANPTRKEAQRFTVQALEARERELAALEEEVRALLTGTGPDYAATSGEQRAQDEIAAFKKSADFSKIENRRQLHAMIQRASGGRDARVNRKLAELKALKLRQIRGGSVSRAERRPPTPRRSSRAPRRARRSAVVRVAVGQAADPPPSPAPRCCSALRGGAL